MIVYAFKAIKKVDVEKERELIEATKKKYGLNT